MKKHDHLLPIFQALLVTFLWSTSFIIIKKGLIEIPPVTFAGLRYFIASVCLLPFMLKNKNIRKLSNLNRYQWLSLSLLGFTFYFLTQGIQFIGLSLLPSASVSLMLSFTPVIVVLLSSLLLKERPSFRQLLGILFFICGAILFFLPLSVVKTQILGLAVMVLAVFANAVSSVLGRKINSKGNINPLIVTFISMAIGSSLLLTVGIARDGVPHISGKAWFSIAWLASINTAYAFTLWNKTLQKLTAMESSIINGSMLIQIGILAWLFLGEALSGMKIAGMIIATIGILFVQLRRNTGYPTK